MSATLKLLFVYLTLGPIAGLIGIPYTLLVRDISLLYRVGMWIAIAWVWAQETLAPIVPIAVSGTERMMKKGSAAIAPGVARVQLLPVIEASEYATREELIRAVRAAIAEALPEEMKPSELVI